MFIRNSKHLLPSDGQVLWRYMDITKFVSMLEEQSLYFCRADILKEGDPYEGSLTSGEHIYSTTYNKAVAEIIKASGNPFGSEGIINHAVKEMYEKMSMEAFINCWHMNERESLAMWKVYSNSGNGIAIKTTFGRLINSLETSTQEVTAGIVTYQDYFLEEQVSKVEHGSNILMRKTTAFDYEKELRLVFTEEFKATEQCPLKLENGESINFFKFKKPNKTGVNIRVDLERLIEAVYVDPKSGAWLKKAVQGLLQTYYNLKYQLRSVPSVMASDLSYNRIQASPVEVDNLDSKYVKSVLEDVINNSSYGEEARKAHYRVHYNPVSGDIIGFYPTNIDYTSVPEPVIIVSWAEWQELINHQGTYAVDVAAKKIIKK